MGSGASRLIRVPCLRPAGAGEEGPPEFSGPLDEALGHSFCYVRSASPAHSRSSSASSSAAASTAAAAAETAFKTISGASVSANSSAPLPVYDAPAAAAAGSRAAGFRSSASFSAIPLQLSGGGGGTASGPLDRGFFLSGPIERRALSGPLDAVPFSGPLVKKKSRGISRRLRKPSLFRRSLSEKNRRPWVVPLRSFAARRGEPGDAPPPAATAEGNVQWAHGKAGEDRVHVVVSEEHRWLFVGIYDGFNGPEAPEFLVGNLYRSVFDELRGLFWEEVEEEAVSEEVTSQEDSKAGRRLWEFLAEGDGDGELEFSGSGRFAFSLSKLRDGFGSWRREGRRLRFPRWRYESEEKAKATREREVTERGSRRRRKAGPVADHELVLRALSRALEVTELAYLEMTDRAMDCNPELALMGSCLLVLLMRDDDVYVMNVGDSRAIVAQCRPPGTAEGTRDEDIPNEQDKVAVEGNEMDVEIEALGRETTELVALQLSTDHSTSIEEEVLRIKKEHPDDNHCIVNDRVKGRLKVTRAFGAGYLKQPKWNDGLLEMFRNEFIGNEPYITCMPSLCHYKLGSSDQFLVLSSDGLYQYLSNEEVVLHVENFMERFPDGDPAQSLIEELLFRAAKKAGMDFYELLDIPQGDRRKYHDDVTVMVISLEGRIWKSSGKYV
ncbi:probable protein phosphatase 2C 26 [Phoenix dactylifera]|uniref:protein-serine/threonine phosphatase n=1 Tax=Phoenix dactylifera TaxID=42345 RepID=A0A8B7CCR4_PHODC|nr:probable protein phosphatase 2C 26 [Phoenix dactylifera]